MIMYSAIFLQPDVVRIIEENGVPTHTDYPYELNKAGYVARVIADVQGLDIPAKRESPVLQREPEAVVPDAQLTWKDRGHL